MSSEEMIGKQGDLIISDDVLSVISAIAAKSIEGVNGMQNSLTGGFVEFLGKKNPSKGVKVTIEYNAVEIDYDESHYIITATKIGEDQSFVKDYMTKNVISLEENTPCEKVIQIMKKSCGEKMDIYWKK